VRPTTLSEVRAVVAANYYEPVPQSVLAQPTVAALIAGLRDRYTEFLTPAQYRSVRRTLAGSYSGIGLRVLPGVGGLLVRRTLPGPARIAGVRPGDTILSVDGAATAGLPLDEAIGRILGKSGSPVKLRVRRGAHTLVFTVLRRSFRLATVHRRLVGTVGVIDVDSFSDGSALSVARAVRSLSGRGATSFVLDLRGNPGGLLSEAAATASLFLPPGSSIASLGGAHRQARIVYSRGRPLTAAPLLVLVDARSASASEVVAGALQDHRRARLVGQVTFGKSLVQELVRLPSGAALRLTVARYLTPAGRDLSLGGLRPNVRSPHALAAALELARRRS
jgi:carboxyl-terminal processing protease